MSISVAVSCCCRLVLRGNGGSRQAGDTGKGKGMAGTELGEKEGNGATPVFGGVPF
jgi:hypothetical protein